jgi:hypothetical protein
MYLLATGPNSYNFLGMHPHAVADVHHNNPCAIMN